MSRFSQARLSRGRGRGPRSSRADERGAPHPARGAAVARRRKDDDAQTAQRRGQPGNDGEMGSGEPIEKPNIAASFACRAPTVTTSAMTTTT